MLAFTFPGQGSQRPGMGEAWVDHDSWEFVAEASDVAGRDIGRLLLSADAEELRHTRNSQLTTFVLSLVVLDAVERVGVVPVGVRQEQPRLHLPAAVVRAHQPALRVGPVADPRDARVVGAQPAVAGLEVGHQDVDARLGLQVHVYHEAAP